LVALLSTMNARYCGMLLALILVTASLSGCGNESSSQKAGANNPKPPAPPPVAVAPQFAPPPSASPPPKATPAQAAIDEAPAPGMTREVAKPGVTGKGGYEEGILAPLTTPLNAYWSAREMAVYDIAIPRAMQLFEFAKERKPNSHDEFMREIIGKNNFKLPELPPGVRYVYDPKRGQLMVERPIGPETAAP